MEPSELTVSVIVPILNEAALLDGFLAHLRDRVPGAEVLVVDGGSDEEPAISGHPVRLLRAPRGRARQMNAGAAAASGDVLWFLHADSRLPDRPLEAIRGALADPRVVGGCFRLRIPERAPVYRISDSLGNLGVDLFRIALGDHGIFCRRDAFAKVDGYPEVPLMEDAELYRRLRRLGRVVQLRPAIETSARRYQRSGPWKTTALYALILGLYAARVPIPVLARLYRKLA